jgi:hypothetical protein
MYQHPRGLGLTAEEAQQWIDAGLKTFREVYTTLRTPQGAVAPIEISRQVTTSPGLWILGGAVLIAVLLKRR